MFLILKHVYPEATAVWDSKLYHVLIDIDGELFDIKGSHGQRDKYVNPINNMSEKEIRNDMLHCRYSAKDREPAW